MAHLVFPSFSAFEWKEEPSLSSFFHTTYQSRMYPDSVVTLRFILGSKKIFHALGPLPQEKEAVLKPRRKRSQEGPAQQNSQAMAHLVFPSFPSLPSSGKKSHPCLASSTRIPRALAETAGTYAWLLRPESSKPPQNSRATVWEGGEGDLEDTFLYASFLPDRPSRSHPSPPSRQGTSSQDTVREPPGQGSDSPTPARGRWLAGPLGTAEGPESSCAQAFCRAAKGPHPQTVRTGNGCIDDVLLL